MKQMFADIGRIVDEDISKRVNQYDVIIEAITNAIQANASEIICLLNSNDTPVKDENGNEIFPLKLKSITIQDNGDGLNNENYESFSIYRSKYKKDMGGKGIGRLIFLKVYKSASFRSRISSLQEERKFVFDSNFNPDNIEIVKCRVEKNFTEVSLENLNKSYKNADRSLDRRIDLDLNVIKEHVLLNLIPTLFFLKKNKKDINIKFIDETKNQSVNIDYSDIPDFDSLSYSVKDNQAVEHIFTLFHKIEKRAGDLYSFYCANNRTVVKFDDKKLKLSLPYGYSGFFLVVSKYLDDRVNNERNDFDIFPVQIDSFSTLSWEAINNAIKCNIIELIKEGIPETEKINKKKIQEINDERPYLIDYIDDRDIDIVGFMDKKQIIEKAKKSFDNAKENILKNAGKQDYTDKELMEAISVAQNELVSYICDRALIIERLRTLVDKKENVEKIIHNLFMEKGTDDEYYCVGKNNLWLLDDRYTTYSFAASDKSIEYLLKKTGLEQSAELLNDRPDLSLFFSNNPLVSGNLKAVLIEIKPFDFKSKPERKKYDGILQLIDYVKALKDKKEIEEIFAFLVTDIDDKFADLLKTDTYRPLFSTDNPIYHRYYEKLGLSIYVISAQAIVKDAEARNKVFLDIIKRHSRLQKFLSKSSD